MAGLKPIEAAFVAAAKGVSGIAQALDYEPSEIPRGAAGLPAVSMLFNGIPEQRDHQTGPATENTWSWTIRLYVLLRDYREAQEKLKALLPELFAIVRRDPTLAGSCYRAVLVDPEDEPEFRHRSGGAAGTLVKALILRARTEEV